MKLRFSWLYVAIAVLGIFLMGTTANYTDTVQIVDSLGNVIDGTASAVTAAPQRTVRVVNSSNLVLDVIGNLSAIYPNSAPSAGQVPVGNAGGTAYAAKTLSQDATIASTGAVTVQGIQAQSAAVGTWSPSATGLTSSGAVTATGHYVKNGAMVYLVMTIAAATSMSSTVPNVTITGFSTTPGPMTANSVCAVTNGTTGVGLLSATMQGNKIYLPTFSVNTDEIDVVCPYETTG